MLQRLQFLRLMVAARLGCRRLSKSPQYSVVPDGSDEESDT
jgi:hypothetical protein